MGERLSYNEWIKWAETVDNLGVANVEPIIVDFLKSVKGNSVFCGNSWDGKNWHDISVKFRQILRDKVLDENPTNYTLPGVLGQSVLKKSYPGINEIILEEALAFVSERHWSSFLNDHTYLIKDYSSLSKIQIIRLVLVGLVRLYIPNVVPAQSFREYLQNRGLL